MVFQSSRELEQVISESAEGILAKHFFGVREKITKISCKLMFEYGISSIINN